MSPQDQANIYLRGYQATRDVPGEQRMEKIEQLVAEFFLSPCEVEYEATLNDIRKIMA